MKINIFHNASVKLAGFYVLIILAISIVFSFWLYNVSLSEIRQSVLRTPGPVEQLLRRENRRFVEELEEFQNQAIEEARDSLIYQFVVLNVFIAVGGALGSYYLARRTLQPIEEAHEAQSRFTADASHELRTPITAMRAETELTLTEPKLTLTQAKKQLTSNMEELDKLTHLSENLLALSTFDDASLEYQDCSVKDVVDQAVSRVVKKAELKNQLINTTKVKDADLHVNQHAITEALVTLLDNAVKYSPKKSEITVSTTLRKKSVDIIVSDKGIGIKEADLPHIFERFYRADSSRTKSETDDGYGIGLSIAHSAVEAHGGSLTVKSKPKKGTTFTLSLPR